MLQYGSASDALLSVARGVNESGFITIHSATRGVSGSDFITCFLLHVMLQ